MLEKCIVTFSTPLNPKYISKHQKAQTSKHPSLSFFAAVSYFPKILQTSKKAFKNQRMPIFMQI